MLTLNGANINQGLYRAVAHAQRECLYRGLSAERAVVEAWRLAREHFYRANFELPEEATQQISRDVTQVAQERLQVVDLLMRRGLTVQLTDIGIKQYTWRRASDIGPARETMSPSSVGLYDAHDYDEVSVPIPFIHADSKVDARDQAASERFVPIDRANVRSQTRVVAEHMEEMVLSGGTVVVGANDIPGLTTHGDRVTGSLSAAWDGTATGEQMVADALAMVQAAGNDNHYGPWGLIVAGNFSWAMDEDHKANSEATVRERILRIEGIEEIVTVDKLASAVILLELSSDVIELPTVTGITDITWPLNPFETAIKVFSVMSVAVKSDQTAQSGVAHYT